MPTTLFPDYQAEQLSLDLFPSSSFTSLCNEYRDRKLTFHLSKRLKSSWYVKIHPGSNTRELHIPAVLNDAPDLIKRALIEWAWLPKARKRDQKTAVRLKKRHLETVIRSHLEREVPSPAVRSRNSPGQIWPTRGSTWDLKEVFDTLNRRWFDSALSSLLRWGAVASKTSYEITRKDDNGNPWHCITIAGTYNHPDVPRFAIEAIMFHEMLHIHIPPRKVHGRNSIHGPDFREKERAFPHYRKWVTWERRHFHRLHALLRRKAMRERKRR